ncbi:MAG TPA: GTP cyclohydrolase II [candidate division Zixibacteria bacterium]|nr:GTP cyclohydrolase II [candidate division Zixibacteria bacterium]
MAQKSAFDSIEAAVAEIRAGRMVIVVDSADRENEGDLVMAADAVTPEAVNFMITHGRGLVCVPLTTDRLRELGLTQMTAKNTARLGTRFSVSVDILEGATTGISAYDRALTISALADDSTRPEDLGRPGHVFPLEAVDGGALARAGHTEAALDLCRLAGRKPAGVLCEILSADGTMARTPELIEMARAWGLKMITVVDLIEYLREREPVATAATRHSGNGNGAGAKLTALRDTVEEIVRTTLPTKFGEFQLFVFRSQRDGKDHLALTKGAVSGAPGVLTRIHSECLTGDTLGSVRCDCGPQLHQALERIQREGCGILLYMRQEGRGIGLANKIKAYALQDRGADTVEANLKLGFDPDLRDYSTSAAMLRALGVESVSLMTNNPRKVAGLVSGGVEVTSRNSAETAPNRFNEKYLRVKKEKLGHLIGESDNADAS